MHHLVVVECRVRGCFNRGIYDPHALWSLFESRRWDGHFREAQKRFYCRVCSISAGGRV